MLRLIGFALYNEVSSSFRYTEWMDRGSRSRRIRSIKLVLSIIYDIYVISFSEGSIYRRGARRWRKLYRVNGHIFQAKRFNRVSIIPCNYHCTIFTLFIVPLFLPFASFTSFMHNLCESRSVAGVTRAGETDVVCRALS